MSIILILILAGLYFLPWIIANQRKNKQVSQIALLNLLLGWTFLGWVFALIWAVKEEGK